MIIRLKGTRKSKHNLGNETYLIEIVKGGIIMTDKGCFLTFSDLEVSKKLEEVFRK
jgi:hypothetical protein